MTETSSPAKLAADGPGGRIGGRIHLRWATVGIVFALALAVVLLRLYRLDEFPPGFNQDEGAHGVDALRLLQGEHAVFFLGMVDVRGWLCMR